MLKRLFGFTLLYSSVYNITLHQLENPYRCERTYRSMPAIVQTFELEKRIRAIDDASCTLKEKNVLYHQMLPNRIYGVLEEEKKKAECELEKIVKIPKIASIRKDLFDLEVYSFNEMLYGMLFTSQLI